MRPRDLPGMGADELREELESIRAELKRRGEPQKKRGPRRPRVAPSPEVKARIEEAQRVYREREQRAREIVDEVERLTDEEKAERRFLNPPAFFQLPEDAIAEMRAEEFVRQWARSAPTVDEPGRTEDADIYVMARRLGYSHKEATDPGAGSLPFLPVALLRREVEERDASPEAI